VLISAGMSCLQMRVMCMFTVATFWFSSLVPHVRLHRIPPTNKENWRQSTVLHGVTECGVRQDIWQMTCTWIARREMTDPSVYTKNGSFVAVSKFDLEKRHQATLWFLASVVFNVVNQRRVISVQDCTDFMFRKRWKIYEEKKGDATGGEISGVLSRSGILEPSTKGMKIKQARGVVTCSYYAGLQNQSSHISFF
jgi:hypothetical protein